MENRQLTLEEQEKAFENIRTDHEKLRRSYLQAKEDYNVLRRSGWMIVFVCFCSVLSENGTATKDVCCNVFGKLDKMFCILGGSLVYIGDQSVLRRLDEAFCIISGSLVQKRTEVFLEDWIKCFAL